MNWLFSRRLKQSLIFCFLILAILPLLFNILLSFYNDRQQIINHRNALANMDTEQMAQEMNLAITGYEDILYQLYTDEELSGLVSELDSNSDAALVRSQIRRKLHGVFWLKDYIVSLTVITKSGEVAFYDRLSTSLQTNVCLNALNSSHAELFEALSASNRVTLYPTQYVTHFAGEDHYLFYLGHRIIHEKAITRTDAVILMAVDAKLFQEVLGDNRLAGRYQKYMFLTGGNQELVWYPDISEIGESVPDVNAFVEEAPRLNSRELAVYTHPVAGTDWQLVNVLDCAPFTNTIDRQLLVNLIIVAVSFGLVFLFVRRLTGRLVSSVDNICQTMQDFSNGDLSVRVRLSKNISPEIYTIGLGLNTMADRIQTLVRAEQDSVEKIKNAEIAALEAQLNPHFIYNTLDTINWMAIEQEQYPISNVVSALGKTLRYGIDNSNGIVRMEEEVNWLKQHLFIHQNRLKNSFRCELDIQDEVLDCRVHKLLLQPFVENAMIHGFSQEQTDCLLRVQIHLQGAKIHIEIADNGRGIPQEVLSALSTSAANIQQGKRYHGMQNAINRLKLYYGDLADITVQSDAASGTRVVITIPAQIGEEQR